MPKQNAGFKELAQTYPSLAVQQRVDMRSSLDLLRMRGKCTFRDSEFPFLLRISSI